MKSYNELLNVLKQGILISKVDNDNWIIKLPGLQREVPATKEVLLSMNEDDTEFIKKVEEKALNNCSMQELKEISGEALSLKRISVLMQNLGYKKYKNRRDANRMYFYLKK